MVRQYVGARYVPKFANPVEWAADTSYEALTIVTFNNASYTSKVQVPPTVGNPANNPKYWALTGNYNAQVEQYRQETETVSNNLTTEITNRKNADTTLQGQITTVSNNLTTEITNRETADATLQGNIISEVATRASADSNLQSQINQIVAPSGEAPSAAEVQNARIGANGVTYDTLGTAIRTQVNNLKEEIGDLTKVADNLVDVYGYTKHHVLDNSGNLIYSSPWNTTEFIPVKTANVIAANDGAENLSIFFAKYDTDKKFIGITYPKYENYRKVLNVSDCAYFKISFEDRHTNFRLCYETDIAEITKQNKDNIGSVKEKIGADNLILQNMIDVCEVTDGFYLNNEGFLVSGEGWSTVRYIPANSVIAFLNKIEAEAQLFICMYDENKKFISGSYSYPKASNYKYSIDGSNAKYVSITIHTSIVSSTTITRLADDNIISTLNDHTDKIKELSNSLGKFTIISTTEQLVNAMEKGGNYYIAEGVYDIVSYLGNDYFANYQPSEIGCVMNDGVYIFAPNALVKANYEGTQVNAINGFAPINTEGHNIKIVGLNVEASNIKYCLHDELGGDTKPYIHEFINCKFVQNGCAQAFGGGLGKNGNILIDGCIFHATNSRSSRNSECSYHNDYRAGAKSTITIKNSVITSEGGTFRFGYYGDSTMITDVIVTNCKLGAEPFVMQENEKYSNVNMNLIAYNNVIE